MYFLVLVKVLGHWWLIKYWKWGVAVFNDLLQPEYDVIHTLRNYILGSIFL